MKGSYYLLLVLPVSILVAGFMALDVSLSREKSISSPSVHIDSVITETRQTDTLTTTEKNIRKNIREVRVERVVRKGNNAPAGGSSSREEALPYFILSAVFIILILALPRLNELSISEKSIVLKLFDEVKAAAADLEDDVSSGQRATESFRTKLPNDKIQKLRERIELVEKVLKRSK